MSEDRRDRMARFADGLVGLSEAEKQAAIEGLSSQDRQVLIAMAEAKAAHHEERAEAHREKA